MRKGSYSDMTGDLITRGRARERPFFYYGHTQGGKARCGHSKKAAVSKPEREDSPETKLAGALILGFQPPEL